MNAVFVSQSAVHSFGDGRWSSSRVRAAEQNEAASGTLSDCSADPPRMVFSWTRRCKRADLNIGADNFLSWRLEALRPEHDRVSVQSRNTDYLLDTDLPRQPGDSKLDRSTSELAGASDPVGVLSRRERHWMWSRLFC